MKYLFPFLLLVLCYSVARGQNQIEILEGTVSYVTSQNVYVRFESTENIQPGDTLFIRKDAKLLPALEVKELSSISCVCSSISDEDIKVSDVIIAKRKPEIVSVPVGVTPVKMEPEAAKIDTINDKNADEKKLKQDISGQISISSYSNFSNSPASNLQRMRYTFSLQADHIGGSKLSAETYMSFVHSNKNWDEIQSNIFNGLKIYNLSFLYDFNETTYLLMGRKINPKLSSVGAIDGLQFEKRFKSMTFGAFLGSRPDYTDYSINLNLLQYGAYIGHDHQSKNGIMQSTLGYVTQYNSSNTDRRFLYFQHVNALVKNLYFFGSVEMDLYQKVNGTPENTFNLSNLYLSLRYRVIKQLSLALSYSARQNIIYYETYKDFIERLLEKETLQGWRFQINYRPIRNLAVGVNAGYRFRPDDPKASMNLYAYVTYSQIPKIKASVTLSATLLETSYISGNIYSIGLTRDIIPGRIYAGLKYRYVDYLYTNSEFSQIQNIGEASISWRIYKKLSVSVYYEGTFEKQYSFNRIYVNLSQRF